MSENTNQDNGKKRPDYIAFVPRQRSGQSPQYVRIGVGFTYKNGSIGVLYDAIPLAGQIILLAMDAEKPSVLSYGSPTRKADFDACMVREAKDGKGESFWTTVGEAYRQEGYISIQLDIVPANKLVLSVPKDNR
jgi:hypothetical protein